MFSFPRSFLKLKLLLVYLTFEFLQISLWKLCLLERKVLDSGAVQHGGDQRMSFLGRRRKKKEVFFFPILDLKPSAMSKMELLQNYQLFSGILKRQQILTQDIWGIFHGRGVVSQRTLFVLLFRGGMDGESDELNHVSLFPLNFSPIWCQFGVNT